MLFTLNDYLKVVTPHLPCALISPDALLSISRIAHDIPPAPLVGFESRLASSSPTVDFAIGITAPSGSRDAFAGNTASTGLAPQLFTDLGWGHFGDFVAQWADPTSTLHDGLRTVWLEWDVDGIDQQMLVPNVLFGFKASGGQALAEKGLHCLTGHPLPAAIRHNLAQCFAALPPYSVVFQVGAMLARQVQGIRVCVYPIHIGQIEDYLARIGWTGPMSEVVDVLAPLCAFATNIALDVDVGAGVSPRIGIECYLDDNRRIRAEPGWTAFLDYLVAHGMCTAAKRDALIAWPGRQHTSQFIWPSIFARGLNHIKLVYQPGRPLEAKAYWGFAQRWADVGATMASA